MCPSRFQLPLADGDEGSCLLTCPICFNSQTHLVRANCADCADDGLSVALANECGHHWRLVLQNHGGELLIEARL
jgi:hypothetical protein